MVGVKVRVRVMVRVRVRGFRVRASDMVKLRHDLDNVKVAFIRRDKKRCPALWVSG
jgi:hypothetical protein